MRNARILIVFTACTLLIIGCTVYTFMSLWMVA